MNLLSIKQNVISFLVGLIFSFGLAISGMTQPQKIVGFLNPWSWDPSLLFVMIGAVGLHMVAYPIVRKRHSPILDSKWHVPTKKGITLRLVLGSALFGIGWGLGGFCPGPGVTSIGSNDFRPVLFVTAMVLGMTIFKKTEPYLKMQG